MRAPLIYFILLFSPLIHAENVGLNNPYRDPDTPYTEYKLRALSSSPAGQVRRYETPLSAASYYSSNDESDLPDAKEWKTHSHLSRRFKQLRDTRFLDWEVDAGLQRRISWLYPNDGCYARAAMVMRLATKKAIPLPGKVFVFGDLKVLSRNSPWGPVTWWYHVAPVVEVKNVKYVIDPAIEPSRALKLKEWLARMGTPEKMEVAICDSGAYVPSSNCESVSNGREEQAHGAQQSFLDMEWERIVELGRDPQRELGSRPPWK
ncbi:MAG TPA: protein-glutamine glutaminase family protein [Bacteriovoracaceae bacterium]|nr:protein-glutamine glutaminase family protein [Bacteriovoracaceae bacterium]